MNAQLSPRTLAEHASAALRGLCNALDLQQLHELAERVFPMLSSSWGERLADGSPAFPSDVSDNQAPFEFSITFNGATPELRILFEVQGDLPCLESNQRAARAFTEAIGGEPGVGLSRFHAIEDLFLPTNPTGVFAVWHAVCLTPGASPSYKIYLNPQARGPARAAEVVEEALVRLGYGRSWPYLSGIAGRRGPDADEMRYFALDLSDSDDTRVKVYFRHHDASTKDLELAFEAASSHVAGDVAEFCNSIVGPGPFNGRPVGSCFAFVGGHERPAKATLYMPTADYIEHEGEAVSRATKWLAAQGLASQVYRRAVEGFASRPLESCAGLQSYLAFRRDKEGPRFTSYLSPEVYGRATKRFPRTPPGRQQRPPAAEIVRRYEERDISLHPMFRRLEREPVDMGKLWLLLANAREAITRPFARRLASVAARTTSDEVRCILVKQLNDELGQGDYSRAHKHMFERLVAGLEPWRPSGLQESKLAPGGVLHDELEAIYASSAEWYGVGASIVVEVFGKQVDQCVGRQLRRQKLVDSESLTWLTLHEELEVDHVEESLTLARLVPADAEAREDAWRGAESVASASWRFFDSMYGVLFT